MILLRSLAAGLCGLTMALPAQAQCGTGKLARGSINPTAVVFTTPTVVQFDAGHIDYSTSLTLTEAVGAKDTWILCFRANGPNLGTSTSGLYTKPIGDLQLRLTGQSDLAFRPVTQVDQLLSPFTGKQGVSLDIRVLLAWGLDEPGQYGTSLLLSVYK